jgi:hypothetical protein
MNITIYLPDDLGRWAKEHGLGLSRMLRGAVEAKRERQQAVAGTLARAQTADLPIEDDDGNTCTARLHGTLIARRDGDVAPGVEVYLGQDKMIYVYDEMAGKLHQGVGRDELRDWLTDSGTYVRAMRALGEEVIIDVGLPAKSDQAQ